MLRTEQPARNVFVIHMDDIQSGWEQSFLLSSDRHHDNIHCNHALEKRHLEQAKERQAGILDFGDLNCAMQGRWDRRADQDALREELRGNNYLNRLAEYNADFYNPYRKQFLLLTPGNHETAILKQHQFNLTQSLSEKLGVAFGAYAGWVRFRFTVNRSTRSSLWLYYNHGYGGGGAVTKGVIQTNRMAVYLPDATFVVTGHTHDQWLLPLARQRINDAGKPFQDKQWHIKCGGYKDEFSPGDGWHVETGKEPKPLGAAWLRFSVRDQKIEFDMTQAG